MHVLPWWWEWELWTFEKCTQMAKHALTRDIEDKPGKQWVRDLEEDMLNPDQSVRHRPRGAGRAGNSPCREHRDLCHPYCRPSLAVNICCHVNRHARRIL